MDDAAEDDQKIFRALAKARARGRTLMVAVWDVTPDTQPNTNTIHNWMLTRNFPRGEFSRAIQQLQATMADHVQGKTEEAAAVEPEPEGVA